MSLGQKRNQAIRFSRTAFACSAIIKKELPVVALFAGLHRAQAALLLAAILRAGI